MRLTRAFDERMVALWKQGRDVGGTFSECGHEAISVGAGCALGPADVVAPKIQRHFACGDPKGTQGGALRLPPQGKGLVSTRDSS